MEHPLLGLSFDMYFKIPGECAFHQRKELRILNLIERSITKQLCERFVVDVHNQFGISLGEILALLELQPESAA